MITVEDLLNMFIEANFQHVILYGYESEENIFDGYLSDMPSEYRELEIETIDNLTNNILIINVDA